MSLSKATPSAQKREKVPLTDERIEATPTPAEGATKLYDPTTPGLFLLVQPRGRPSWRLKYRFGGRESSLSLGAYSPGDGDHVSIEEARAEAANVRKLIHENTDPADARRKEKTALHIATVTTFKVAADSFLAKDDTLSERTKDKHKWLLSLLTSLHKRPLHTIDAPDVLRVLENIAAMGKREAARRCGQFVGRVFRHAINRGWYLKPNPADNLRGELPPVVTESHPAVIDTRGFGLLMRVIDGAGEDLAYATVRHGLQLLARTALRPGELRGGLWSEINTARAEWVIPAERMKMKRPHLVPLSTQALAILEAQREVSGNSPYIFPGVRAGRTMSDAGMGVALFKVVPKDLHVPHGFRSSFSSIANGHGWDEAVIELALSHAKRDKIAGIYDRSQRNLERRALLQWWADSIERMARNEALERYHEGMLKGITVNA